MAQASSPGGGLDAPGTAQGTAWIVRRRVVILPEATAGRGSVPLPGSVTASAVERAAAP